MSNIIEEEFIKCPKCHCSLKKSNLGKHLKKHLKKSSKTSSEQPVSKKEINNPQKKKSLKTYYICKQCNKKIVKGSVISHLHKAHNFKPKNEELAHKYYFDEVKVSVSRTLSVDAKNNHQIDPVILEKSNIKAKVKFASDAYALAKKKDLIKCSFCNNHVSKQNYIRHLYLQHSINLYEELGLKMPKSLLIKGKTENTEKVELDRRMRPYSEDVFDRAMVVSGGGYGLGKNRRH